MREVLVAETELVTAYGAGKEACMKGLYAGRHAFRKVTEFPFPKDTVGMGALIQGIRENCGSRSAIWGMLDFFDPVLRNTAEKSRLYLATTLGEIDLLETSDTDTVNSLLNRLLEKYSFHGGYAVSAACASGNIALLRAAEQIRNGTLDSVVILGCDLASEFACSGFSTLRAFSKGIPRPYDRDRDGLLLGDAAGVVHLVSPEYAEKHSSPVQGCLTGWGITCDAIHITAPDLSGRELARAVRRALDFPENNGKSIAAVIGHGTGTVFNDQMEMSALNLAFPQRLPLVSTKGGCGHTLGAAGLIQLVAALEVLKRKQLFPQTNLNTPDPAADISASVRSVTGDLVLTLNAGFGGINAVLTAGEA